MISGSFLSCSTTTLVNSSTNTPAMLKLDLDSNSRPCLSEEEAIFYYAGLPSAPRLVGRSSTTEWKAARGPEAYNRRKVLGTVGIHPIQEFWEDTLSRAKITAYLDSKKIIWTSIDIVRIGYVDESSRPVILWIGVQPNTLLAADGVNIACTCKQLLIESKIIDVDVEIRESSVTLLRGPKLFAPEVLTLEDTPTASVREPLTPTLGLGISTTSNIFAEGTGGFFLAEGGDSKQLLLITARHVVLEPNKDNNKLFHHHSSGPRHEVILLGNNRFKKLEESIQNEIGERSERILDLKARIGTRMKRDNDENELAKLETEKKQYFTFYKDVTFRWGDPYDRVIGHVAYAPPIKYGVGAKQFTQDFAIISLDSSKFDASNFLGNVIDLGTKYPSRMFTQYMYPNVQNATTFKYPRNRILKLQGIISEAEMRQPPETTLDRNFEPCLMVIKRGNGSDLTIGRANNIRSCTRWDIETGDKIDSMEWVILPHGETAGAFSTKGDSGSVVVDGMGRIGGIITGGTGATPSTDVTYVTSATFLMESIRVKYPNAHFNLNLCT